MAEIEIEYFYSTHSAFAYIGHQRLLDICARKGAHLRHRPIELSPVVEHAGGLSFAGRTQAHVDYFFGREIERWAAFRGVEVLGHRPSFHDAPLALSSGVMIAAAEAGCDLDRLAFALLQGHWRDDMDLNDAGALDEVLQREGVDAAGLLKAAMSEPVQAQLAANTQEAMARNVFGSPTYVLNGDMFYGQDHLELLEHALETPFGPHRFQNPPVG
ncbi:2-hydroxychromene-2-carboxylate isomerase [Shimia sp. R9_1]|uniref:2-hydroxychromene-2-carboxylate isomerase n=1 Tax=Shimia sp. R9_1 TaxID=2821111 RepID=UPI001ADBDADE|nr:2-hydroxychromene-2-carboxylate isomerase [Shimia sp. R9_1]MBO9409189.1 2-hydroxychromene-2-carboxylate isomerase [Shimia sp. R9_1]